MENITDFKALDKHLKECGKPFKDALVDYYRVLGEQLGFTVRIDASIIEYGINLGKVNLIWLEPKILFSCEFGSLEEILKHLWRIVEYNPEKTVLLLSSGSQCKPEEVVKLVEQSKILKELRERFVVLDVSEKRVVYPRD
ncbi:MAG: hypothetical protein ABH851_02920 [Methanobacteriota archaeon]